MAQELRAEPIIRRKPVAGLTTRNPQPFCTASDRTESASDDL